MISGRHYIFSKKIKVVAKFSWDHSIKEKKGIQGTYSISFVTQWVSLNHYMMLKRERNVHTMCPLFQVWKILGIIWNNPRLKVLWYRYMVWYMVILIDTNNFKPQRTHQMSLEVHSLSIYYIFYLLVTVLFNHLSTSWKPMPSSERSFVQSSSPVFLIGLAIRVKRGEQGIGTLGKLL